jgi:Sulfotransferase domain
MNQNNKANLFIIGAPKSGTTSLYEYLKQHPDVFMCVPKEPHYFSTDFADLSIVDNLSEYSDLFKKCPDNIRVLGEASAWYLYSKTAIKNIYKYNDNAKIIVVIRNPIEVLKSLHSNYLFNYYEDQGSFNDAWNLQEVRKAGEQIPKYCKEPKLLQYKAVTSFGTQLQDLYSIFPENQIKCILFDDFIANTQSVYESILEFLDLNTNHKIDFKKNNSSKSHRIEFINRYLLNPPGGIKFIWKKIKKIFGNEIVKHVDKIILLNTKEANHQNIDDESYSGYIDEYDDDIKKIELLLGRDLSSWRTNNKPQKREV